MDEISQGIGPFLSEALDHLLLAREYSQSGRIHIRSILSEDSAAQVSRTLVDRTPYNLVLNNGPEVFDLKHEGLAKLPPLKKRELWERAWQGARQGFQFIYDNHRMTEAGEPYPVTDHFLANIVSFLNGEKFLSFARTVTGEPGIALADAQATRYGPGHFLTTHDDHAPDKKRLAAYVLNMTPNWRADWGGNLLFLDREGHIAEGYAPAFNALNLFKVPQPHCVSHVAAFAGGHRYSITGWLRAR